MNADSTFNFRSFFSREADIVASDLIGRTIGPPGWTHEYPFEWQIAAVAALTSSNRKNDSLFRAAPGDLVNFCRTDGCHIGIAAHPPGMSGLVEIVRLEGIDERSVLEGPSVFAALGGLLAFNASIIGGWRWNAAARWGEQGGLHLGKPPVRTMRSLVRATPVESLVRGCLCELRLDRSPVQSQSG